MKKLLLLACMLGSAALTQAQYQMIPGEGRNPGELNADPEYPEGGGLPTDWKRIDAGTAATARWTADQALPFAFQFNGAAVTSFKVSTSGVLTFDVGTALAAPGYTRAALPSASVPDKSVCIWGLSGLGANDYIETKVFGTAGSRQLWIQFSSYSYGTSSSGDSQYAYWSIVLEEGSNNIFIVDQRTGGYDATVKKVSAGIQVDGSTALAVPTSPDLLSIAGSSAAADDNHYYRFVYGTIPDYDVAILGVNNVVFGKGKAIQIYGRVINNGSKDVNAVTVNYSIDGGTAVTSQIGALSIRPGASGEFDHPIFYTASATGSKSLRVWISKVNGMDDATPANNELTKTVPVVDHVRSICNEVFTSSTCGPCNAGNATFESVIKTHDRNTFTTIKYQQNFPGTGDPYSTSETVNRRNFYSINSIPRMEVDGQWDGNAQSFTNTIFDQYQTVATDLEIEAKHSISNKKVTLNVTLKPFGTHSEGTWRIYAAVIEKKTVQNVKTNGETFFYNVMKKMLPNETGTAISGGLTAGTNKTFNLSFSFPGNYTLAPNGQSPIDLATQNSVESFNNLAVVVFVQNTADKKILQSVWSTDLHPTGFEDVNEEVNLDKLYPNPAKDVLNIDFNTRSAGNVTMEVKNLMGQTMKTIANTRMAAGDQHISADIADLPGGVYFLTIQSGEGTATRKFMIAK